MARRRLSASCYVKGVWPACERSLKGYGDKETGGAKGCGGEKMEEASKDEGDKKVLECCFMYG